MTQVRTKLNRRNFLLALGVGGAATAVAVIANNPAQEIAPANPKNKRSTRGYAASEHINNYYRTTKV